MKRRQLVRGGPPRRGEGSRGSVTENAKANAVGVGCVRCARAHLPFALRGAPAESFVVAVGSAPNRSQRAISRDCQNAPRGRKISLTWTHFSSHGRYLESRVTGLHSGREGRGWGSRTGHCRRFFSSPMLQPSAWSNALAKLLQTCFRHRCGVRWTQDMILGSTEPQCACSCQLCCPRCR